uniref:zinc finger CCCH domain-containing protein 67-like n=1 Tax=Erigeron canadensis TaxID=72917 RepID=UPI001CB89A67|nr:zinc finger CCCH domain-containing protein 67-like [Erigeron canadensis]
METHESKTQLKDLKSDISINNTDEIVSILAKELETLILSCNKNNEDSDQDIVKPKDEIGDVGIDLKQVLEDGLEKSKDFDEEKIVGEVRVFDEEKVVNEVRVSEEEKDVGEIRVLEDFGGKDESENVGVDLSSGVRFLEKNGGGGGGEEWGNDEYYDGWGDEDDDKNRNDGEIRVFDGRNDGEMRVYDDDNFGEKHVLDSLENSYCHEDDKYNYNGGGADREFGNYESENGGGGGGGGSVSVYPDDGRMKSYHYPLRPDAEDCSYYVRTGMCKFGSNCKFNHPLKKRNQPTKETRKPREENMERPGQQIECKFYLSSGGCKYGKACKFSHTKGKTVTTPVVEYNFLGLPIRPGEKECPYYMRNGSCKYGPNCRFNHPDPTAVGGTDAPAAYGNDGPAPLPTAPQANMPSWSAPRTPEPTAAFVPMMYSPTRNMPPPNQDWNNYQAPVPTPAHVYPSSERGLPIPPAFFLNNAPNDNMYSHHQQQMQVSDYPERPGQPDCSYFMKTGDCKYKATCKFHHPKSRTNKASPSVLSDKGLPLRPDQSICSHYSRYGICKYGPACKYDHPVNYSNSTPAGQGYRSDGSFMQQSV